MRRPPDGRGRGPLTPASTPPADPADESRPFVIITDRRGRMLARLAAIELTWMAYGGDAYLRPTPAGPDRCPPDCAYCEGRWAA